MTRLDPALVKNIIAAALDEDIGSGDITTNAVVSHEEEVTAELIAKEECVVAGLPVAEAVFKSLDPRLRFEPLVKEGSEVAAGHRLATVSGNARPILMGERTALNFLQHLSGVATMTRHFVELVKDTGVSILDTRKTMPGMRALEKYAVGAGGGINHRMGLFDRVLIKDNHLRVQERYGVDAVGRAVALAREKCPGVLIEVEADTLDAVESAVNAGADWILLDNMTVDEFKEAVGLVEGRATTEASGGITLDTVREIALTGVQYISVGALTHSAKAVDISLKISRQ